MLRLLINDSDSVIVKRGRFTFEQIHDTKEQIFYERAGKHKAKERMFKLFKWVTFLGDNPF